MAIRSTCGLPGLAPTRSQLCSPRNGAHFPLSRPQPCAKLRILRSRPPHADTSRSESSVSFNRETPISAAAGPDEPHLPVKSPPAPHFATACCLAAAACLSMAYMSGRAVAGPTAVPTPTITTTVSQQQSSQSSKPFFTRTRGSEPIGGSAWARYKFLQLFALPTYGKMLAVIVIALPALAVGAALYHTAVRCSWSEALMKSYQVLNNCPGDPDMYCMYSHLQTVYYIHSAVQALSRSFRDLLDWGKCAFNFVPVIRIYCGIRGYAGASRLASNQACKTGRLFLSSNCCSTLFV